MRIDQVGLTNVMRFESFDAEFGSEFNVIIGENGSGKTSLLTVLRRVLAPWTAQKRLPLGADLQRETIEVANGEVYRARHLPFRLVVEGVGPDGDPLQHMESGSRRVIGNVRARELHERAEADPSVDLPVIAFFSPWREPPETRRRKVPPDRPSRRIEGYEDALDLHADYHRFAGWFKRHEMARVEGGGRFPVVEAVRHAIVSCLPDARDLRWQPVENEILVRLHNDWHPLWRLSDGFRTMLALVGELAWRAAVLNPGRGEEVARRVSGVVLIDEIDLHLHPRWQRRVVGDLRRTFPHVQFIATTHSPFVVQSMEADEVINLDREPSLDFQQSSVEDIAEVEMGVDGVQRSQVFHDKVAAAREYLVALEQNPKDARELARLKARLDELQLQFGNDPVYVASLLQKRAAKGLE